MPSNKKRINLTVPDQVYEKLQVYKEQNGITNDASACLQLIIKQLKAQEETLLMMKFVRESSIDQLIQLSNEGLNFVKNEAAKLPPTAE